MTYWQTPPVRQILTVSNVSPAATGGTNGFNSFTSAGGFDNAAQISGAGSCFNPATQAAAGNALVFTITADSGFTFSLTGFSFEARSVSTAPADIGFTINGTPFDFSSIYSNDSTKTTIANSSLTFTGLTDATISIQGWNGGSGALQLDDLSAVGAVSAVPEPRAVALIVGGLLAVVILQRRRRLPA